jgi:CAAX protease family protein
MLRSLRLYFIALVIVWIALGVAADIYSQRLPAYSHSIMIGILPAFWIESIFFVGAGFESMRIAFGRIRSRFAQSALLLGSALVPYVIATMAVRTFESHAFYIFVGYSAVVSFWYCLAPRRIAYDIGFLAICAAALVLRIFPRLYVAPVPQLEISVLGHLMLIHVGIFALLVQRDLRVGPVSFWPTQTEWREGLIQFVWAILPLVILGWSIRFAVLAPRSAPPLTWTALALGYFFGVLWVVALSEDLFRSVITVGLLDGGLPKVVAIVVSALVFGCAHLWYRDFPNWRFFVLASVAHLFYSIAFVRAGSVRASMVTHALVVTSWRMLFRS